MTDAIGTEFVPYRPPWYPHDDNPWDVLGNMSGTVTTRYDQWCNSLAPGELLKLIREHQESR